MLNVALSCGTLSPKLVGSSPSSNAYTDRRATKRPHEIAELNRIRHAGTFSSDARKQK